MQKEIKIFPIQQYIIDQVRLKRNELGISAEELSLEIGSSSSLIGIIESPSSPTTYTDHMLNIIAGVFTRRSLVLYGKKQEYTLFDFYPKKTLSDIPQSKEKIKLPETVGLTSTLNKILDTQDFFIRPRTISEITEYCNSLTDKDWKSNNVTSTLDHAIAKGKLKKMELSNGAVLYQKA